MQRPEAHRFEDAGAIPNSRLPVLVYHGIEGARAAQDCAELFARNGWRGAWVDGIYPFHHFHSTSHEVLGIVAGSASVVLGGPGGRRFDVVPGDVLVLPAGTGHFNAGATDDLRVVGAYPGGMWCDLRRGVPAERDEVLANIAAVPLPDTDPVAGADAVRVNLLGVWYGCRAAGARMLADGRGGSIINISSVLGLGAQQNFPPAYIATKAGVINLTRALALSWADRGVRVNAIASGWFPSEMTEPFFQIPGFFDAIMVQQPGGRIGDPDELAGPLLFLASDASSYVSGHTLVVDGGMTAGFGAPRRPEEMNATFAQVIPHGLGERIMPAV